jgi:ligand-binding sensor domain-containing protein/two-component sensor histidine kinase
MKRIAIILLSVASSCICNAQAVFQKAAIYDKISSRHGLSSNKVIAVIQDDEDFYWIATLDGLNRFDGTNIKTYRHNKQDSSSLSHNHCTSLWKDKAGNIWIGTLNGLNRYNSREGFRRYYLKHDKLSAVRLNWIRSITEDSAGNIWVAAFGLWKINPQTGQATFYNDNPSHPSKALINEEGNIIYDPLTNGIWCGNGDLLLYFDIPSASFYHRGHNPYQWELLQPRGNIIFAIDSKHTVWFYSPRTQRLCKASLPDGKIEYSNLTMKEGISKIQCDNKGRVWISRYNQHPVLFDPSSNKADSSFLHRSHFQSPASEVMDCFYEDKAGNYWLCSSNGVSIFNPEKQGKEYIELNRETLENGTGHSDWLIGLSVQDKNNIWLYKHSGIFRCNRSNNRVQRISHPLLQNNISGLLAAGGSTLFISTYFGLHRYDVNKQSIEKTFSANFSHRLNLIQDKHGNIWAGSWGGGVYKFDKDLNLLQHFTKSNGLAHDRIIGLYYSAENDSVFAGYNGGAGYVQIHVENKGITNHIIPLPVESEKNIANTINCFLKDSKDNLWIGSYGGGLFLKPAKASSFKNITQADGLKSNFINAIVEDSLGNVWISTSSGLSILQKGRDHVINITDEIELPDNDFYGNCTVIDAGSLAVFDNEKLVIYYPAKLLMKEKPGRILIGDFKVFDKPVDLPSGQEAIRLSHGQNFFSFEFSLLKTNPEQEIPYAYKLEGFDKDWMNLKKLQPVSYTNVPPGRYVFKVKADSRNGEWLHFSPDVPIIISPPFWKTGWFLIASCLSLLALTIAVYRYRINELKKVFAVRYRISQDLHDEIGSTLSGVALFSELAQQKLKQRDGDDTDTYLQRIRLHSKEMAEKMNDIVWAINPQNDTLEKMINKLRAYSVSVCAPKNIKFHFNADEKIDQGHLNMESRQNIYLLSKEAINNAVKYADATNIYFSLTAIGGRKKVIIKDDGKGFDTKAETKGNGLKNIHARTIQLKGQLSIHSDWGKGTTVEVIW